PSTQSAARDSAVRVGVDRFALRRPGWPRGLTGRRDDGLGRTHAVVAGPAPFEAPRFAEVFKEKLPPAPRALGILRHVVKLRAVAVLPRRVFGRDRFDSLHRDVVAGEERE